MSFRGWKLITLCVVSLLLTAAAGLRNGKMPCDAEASDEGCQLSNTFVFERDHGTHPSSLFFRNLDSWSRSLRQVATYETSTVLPPISPPPSDLAAFPPPDAPHLDIVTPSKNSPPPDAVLRFPSPPSGDEESHSPLNPSAYTTPPPLSSSVSTPPPSLLQFPYPPPAASSPPPSLFPPLSPTPGAYPPFPLQPPPTSLPPPPPSLLPPPPSASPPRSPPASVPSHPPPPFPPRTKLDKAKEALLAFKAGITSDPYNALKSWRQKNDVCTYKFVSCTTLAEVPPLNDNPYNKTERTVAALHLNGLNLSGTITPKLDLLEDLGCLHLGSNRLNGLVPFLSSLTLLGELDLSCNLLSGPFPEFIHHLAYIKYLDLRYNQFTGNVPRLIFLRGLDVLAINNNKFTQDGMWTALPTSPASIVVMSNNPLKGKLSSSDLSLMAGTLQELALNSVQLTGSIPESLGYLNATNTILFGDNSFSGPLPKRVFNLSSLEVLDISSNKLVQNISNSPLFKLSKLKVLNISNNYFTGNPPTKLPGVNVTASGNCLNGTAAQKASQQCEQYFRTIPPPPPPTPPKRNVPPPKKAPPSLPPTKSLPPPRPLNKSAPPPTMGKPPTIFVNRSPPPPASKLPPSTVRSPPLAPVKMAPPPPPKRGSPAPPLLKKYPPPGPVKKTTPPPPLKKGA